MKWMLLILLPAAVVMNDPLRTSKINKAKTQAKNAFNDGNYKEAISRYKYLVDSMSVTEDEVLMNLAHAYYLENDTANATKLYQGLISSPEAVISSKASQQLGVMANQKGRPEEALRYFKKALKANPSNKDARYNYEMVKRKLDQKKQQEEQQKKDDQKNDQNKDQEPSEFAKKLKAQADQLVAQKRYGEAYDLMMDGLKKDKTVSTYQDYIKRIKDVSDINRK